MIVVAAAVVASNIRSRTTSGRNTASLRDETKNLFIYFIIPHMHVSFPSSLVVIADSRIIVVINLEINNNYYCL